MSLLLSVVREVRNFVLFPSVWRALTFFIGSVAAQGSASLTGLFLARWLSVHDYALYTLMALLMVSISALTKGGVRLGFTAILGRHWPNMERVSALVDATLEVRRVISLFVLPPLLAVSVFLLIQNNAGLETTILFVIALAVFWWADMRTRVIDQILLFAKQATRLQVLDTAIGLARLFIVFGLHIAGVLSSLTAVLVGVMAAVVRIGPIDSWIKGLLPDVRLGSAASEVREIRTTAMLQLPVDLFTVFQSVIVLFLLSVFGSVENVAGYGAIGRIAQLLVPVSALSYAFCIPIFARATSRIVPILAGLVALCSIPGIVLVLASLVLPGPLLWLIGPHYAGLDAELAVSAVVAAFNNSARIAWILVAHRGWNRWAWLQIPFGLGWCAVAVKVFDVGSITGALWLQGGFSLGLMVAALADLISANRRGVLLPHKD
jgi:hypothetical protein